MQQAACRIGRRYSGTSQEPAVRAHVAFGISTMNFAVDDTIAAVASPPGGVRAGRDPCEWSRHTCRVCASVSARRPRRPSTTCEFPRGSSGTCTSRRRSARCRVISICGPRAAVTRASHRPSCTRSVRRRCWRRRSSACVSAVRGWPNRASSRCGHSWPADWISPRPRRCWA